MNRDAAGRRASADLNHFAKTHNCNAMADAFHTAMSWEMHRQANPLLLQIELEVRHLRFDRDVERGDSRPRR